MRVLKIIAIFIFILLIISCAHRKFVQADIESLSDRVTQFEEQLNDLEKKVSGIEGVSSDDLDDAINKAESAADRAESAANRAEDAADRAESAANRAEGDADRAEDAANKAEKAFELRQIK